MSVIVYCTTLYHSNMYSYTVALLLPSSVQSFKANGRRGRGRGTVFVTVIPLHDESSLLTAARNNQFAQIASLGALRSTVLPLSCPRFLPMGVLGDQVRRLKSLLQLFIQNQHEGGIEGRGTNDTLDMLYVTLTLTCISLVVFPFPLCVLPTGSP